MITGLPQPDYENGDIALYCGDCLEILPRLSDGCVDAVVTDGPYGLKFMGKEWDHGVPGIPFWSAAIRVAKPGAHLLAFGGTRTHHRLTCAIEDAGWEIRDTIGWLYGSGFPKSLNVSKAIDATLLRGGSDTRRLKQTNEQDREEIGERFEPDRNNGFMRDYDHIKRIPITAPATDDARKWNGWGTGLKPAWEPIIVARKPLIGTVAENVLEHGTGAINIDGCRIGNESVTINTWDNGAQPFGGGAGKPFTGRQSIGRFPANIIHDGSAEVEAVFPRSKSCTTPSNAKPKIKYRPGQGNYQSQGVIYPGDDGSASRFFYCAKASKSERTMQGRVENNHPTVKPITLMRYLVRLITPPGGVVLDPFLGSGSTGIAAIEEGMQFIGIEKEPKYFDIAVGRIEKAFEEQALYAEVSA